MTYKQAMCALLIIALGWVIIMPEPEQPLRPGLTKPPVPWYQNYGPPPLRADATGTSPRLPFVVTLLMVAGYIAVIRFCFSDWRDIAERERSNYRGG